LRIKLIVNSIDKHTNASSWRHN